MDRITQFVAWAMLSIALFPVANPAAYSVTLYANVLNANTQITANVLTFNGISYASNTLFVSNTLLAAEANYSVNATAVPGFAFAGWTATTNISLSSPSLPNAIATITGNGILTGEYDAVSNVVFAHNGAEGGVFLNGTSYPNGASNTIPNGDYPVNAVVGPGFVFSNWTAEGANAIFSNATAANTFVNISGNVVITANFATANIPSPSPYPTVPTTNEPNLSIILTNSSFLNNSQLNTEPFFNVTPVLHRVTINISENVPYGIIESNGVNVPANTNRYYVLFNGSTYSLYHLHVVKAIPNLSITVYGKTYTDPQYGDVFVQVPRNYIKNGAYSLPIGISSALLPNNIADFTYSVNITNLAYNILPSSIGSGSINAQGISNTFNPSSIPVNEMIKITFDTSGNANYSSLDPVVYVSPNYNNLVYSANTQLGSDVVCGNLTVDSGVALTTNGFNILCINTITNDGLLQAGGYLAGGAGSPGAAIPSPGAAGGNNPPSYGGSGGGGGGGGSGGAGNNGAPGGPGGNTLVAGGAGGLNKSKAAGEPGSSGSTPSSPAVLDNANIITWYTGGFQNYIAAASGGGGGAGYPTYSGGNGGASSFGIYIQANDIIAGNIVASGGAGAAGVTGARGGGGGGGGGGGIVLLAYGPGGYTSGTYNFAGGAGGVGGDGTTRANRTGGAGGAGGNGNVLTYSWTTPPITIIPASLFTETGLPTGAKWNVTYNAVLNSSTTSTVLFLGAPGSHPFAVAYQVVDGNVYVPSPASGSVVAGNTTAITFTEEPPEKIGNVIMPSGIIGYVPIQLINSQTSASPAPFQQMVTIDSRVFKPLESKSLANMEFFYANGTIIPSWLESGNANTSNYTVYWLKISNGISASSNLTVYAGFAPFGVYFFNGNTIGEAPQLSSTYGGYDNGANIFDYYTNFAGSAMPANWIMTGITYTVDNGITIDTGSGAFGYYNSIFTAPYAVDTYESGNSLSNLEVTDLMSSTTTLSTYVELYLGNTLGWVLQETAGSVGNSTGALNTYYVHTLEGSTTVSGYENYTYLASESSDPMQQYIGYFTGTVAGDAYSANWIRVRAMPPGGVMPAEIVGDAFPPYLNIQNNPSTFGNTDNVITKSNPIIDALNLLINGNVVATGTKGINYTIPSTEPAGVYNITSVDLNTTMMGVSENDTLRTIVPAYFYNSVLWSELVPLEWKGVVIANPDSGPGTSADPNYTSWIGNVVSNGGSVVGYVYTDYDLRPLSTVENDISTWYSLYPAISGIFLDQYNSSQTGNAVYYNDLYTYIKNNHPGNSLVIGNPGVPVPAKFIGSADIFNIYEGNYQAFLSFSLPQYLKVYGTTKFSAIVTNTAQSNTISADVIARENGLGYIYETNNDSANPYNALPPYFPNVTNGTTSSLHTTEILNILQPSCTISLSTNSIDFGNIDPNVDMPTSNAITDSNSGSAGSYMYAYGGNWIGTSSSNTFYVANTLWNPSSSAQLIGNQLLLTSSDTEIYVPPSSSNNIYFGVGVPPGQTADSYSQNITILNEC